MSGWAGVLDEIEGRLVVAEALLELGGGGDGGDLGGGIRGDGIRGGGDGGRGDGGGGDDGRGDGGGGDDGRGRVPAPFAAPDVDEPLPEELAERARALLVRAAVAERRLAAEQARIRGELARLPRLGPRQSLRGHESTHICDVS
jgi:hypothetical protein